MYKKQKHIHFIGIGGIGMSGIAKVVKQQGYIVSGCDLAQKSALITELEKLGCTIFKGHCTSHITHADVLVYSSAVTQENKEVQAALAKGIPVIPRAIMLAELMRTKYTAAIAGSHGKTTTTSMISHVLLQAQLDPTIIIGGILKNISSHSHLGTGSWLIAEADESDKSFLHLSPSIAVVTNIDAEHLDTYKDLDEVKQTFKSFLSRLPFYGKAILCLDDQHVQSILPLSHIPTIKYGLHPQADLRGTIISLDKKSTLFEVFDKKGLFGMPNTPLGSITLHMPGKHNVLNALAALSLCSELEISFENIKNALESFAGVVRRFEFKGTFKGAEIFDDYGHHPTEIANTLLVAHNRAHKNLHVVFQPHRFTRTQKLWQEFVDTFAFAALHTLFITDIYPASEQPIDGITTQNLVKAIKEKNPALTIKYTPTYENAFKQIPSYLQEGDMLLTIGAGKVYTLGEQLLQSDV